MSDNTAATAANGAAERTGDGTLGASPLTVAASPAPSAAPTERMMPAWAFYAFAGGAFALDQAVKAWLRATVPVGGMTPILPGVFQLTHTQNRGMAFSLLEGATGVLAVAALLVIAAIVYAQTRIGPRLPVLLGLALALPLGGALGNLLDRVRLGYVTDLFDFTLINFPVFNVADAAITVGISLLAWRVLTTPAPPDDAPTAPGAEPSGPRG